jgi:transketolase
MIDYVRKANQIRKDVVDVAVKNGAAHLAPSLSCIDILTALYYGVMNLSDSPLWEDRDRLVLSKAHGCYGLYSILSDKGYLDRKEWDFFYKGSGLSGCLEGTAKNGIEVSCGSLGHGLPMAVGMAFGGKLQKKKFRVYCVIGDGEMQEGSNWEAVQFAAKHKLWNLTVIVDNNRLQAMDFVDEILTIDGVGDDLQRKMSAFGFEVETCDGHNPEEIISVVEKFLRNQEKLNTPQVLIADTVKGYGLLCMENIPKFHFRLPTEAELEMGNRYE